MDPVGERIRSGRPGRRGRRSGPQRIAVAVALLLLTATPNSRAADSPNLKKAIDEITPFARQVVFDVKDLGTAPLRWREKEWTRFGKGAALVLGAYAVDDQLVRIVSRQQNPVLNRYLKGVTHLGGGYGVDVAALLAIGGYLRSDERMFDAGVDALEASVLASGIVTPAIKHVVGRARPIREEGKHSFDPFSSSKSYESFPSGHATNAFAVYTAIAMRYEDNRYVPAIAYTIATSVAAARVHDRVHFASDVLAGGLIGHAIAKSIVANHRRARIVLMPTERGLVAHIRF